MTAPADGGSDAPRANGELPHLAHDGPVLYPGEGLDPAGAVTARNVEAGPTEAGEEDPIYDDDDESSNGKKRRRGTVTGTAVSRICSARSNLCYSLSLVRRDYRMSPT